MRCHESVDNVSWSKIAFYIVLHDVRVSEVDKAVSVYVLNYLYKPVSNKVDSKVTVHRLFPLLTFDFDLFFLREFVAN